MEQAAVSVKEALKFTAGKSNTAHNLDLDAWMSFRERLLKLLKVESLLQCSPAQSREAENAMTQMLDLTMEEH